MTVRTREFYLVEREVFVLVCINSLYFVTRLDEMSYGSFHVQYGFKNKVILLLLLIVTFLALSGSFIFIFQLITDTACHTLASYADTLWAHHSIFLFDEPKECLHALGG